ncbi:MAG: N-acetylmuramoyl-L-alanine amidase [Anaerolineae bacterium]|nr:N-acetylmuramoyl-L-alanine amidase [Anaerolineae bacterium]
MPRQQTGLSRRAMLALLGLGGLTVAGGAGGALLLLLLRAARQLVALPTSPTPPPAALIPPPIVPRAQWGALPPDHNAPNEPGFYSLDNPEGWRVYEGDLRAVYRTVVIHHSANYGRDDIDTLLYIQRRHREERGWADVAYHFFVGREGMIYAGRPLDVRGTHVAGYNTGSVGVCLLGNFEETEPTVSQLANTLLLVQWLAAILGLTHLAGHSEFNPETECPGDHLIPYLDVLAAGSGLARGTGGYVPSEEQLLLTLPAASAGQSP